MSFIMMVLLFPQPNVDRAEQGVNLLLQYLTQSSYFSSPFP